MRTMLLVGLVGVVGVAVSVGGCKKEETPAEQAKRAVQDGVKQAQEAFEASRDKAVENFKDQLKAARQQMDQLAQQAEQKGGALKQSVQPYLDQARKQADAIEAQADALKNASLSQYQGIIEKIGPMMDKMMGAMAEAMRKVGG